MVKFTATIRIWSSEIKVENWRWLCLGTLLVRLVMEQSMLHAMINSEAKENDQLL